MDLIGEPLEKRRRLSESCVICEQTLDEKSVDNPFIRNPTLDGVKAVLRAAEIRQDTVRDRLLKIKDGILNQTVTVRYHKKCRASYTTASNLKYVQNELSTANDTADNAGDMVESGLSRIRRTDTSTFNIRTDCFICEKSYKRAERLNQKSPLAPELQLVTVSLQHLLKDSMTRLTCECCHIQTNLRMMQNTTDPVAVVISHQEI